MSRPSKAATIDRAFTLGAAMSGGCALSPGGRAECDVSFSAPNPSFCEVVGASSMLCFETPTLHFVK